MAAAPPRPLTIYLSLTSSPSTPRAQLILHPPSDQSGSSNDNSNSNIAVTASELRRRASELTSVPLESIKLIFRGRVIPVKDTGDVVKEFKLEDGCVVHVMGKPSVGANSAAATATTASSAAAVGATQVAGATVTLPSSANGTHNTANINYNNNDSNSSSSAGMLQAAISKLRSSNDFGTYREGLSTAHKLLGNIITNPTEAKYRSIKKTNPAFLRRLGSLPGGPDLLFAAGFVAETKDDVDGRTEYYVLTPSADAWPRLVAARDEVGRALSGAQAGGVDRSTLVGGAGSPNANPPPPLPAFPGAPAIQSMRRDPNMVRNMMGMMNDPRVQNMMNSDPRFANNPMLQQSIRALQSNPEMMQQVAQMMSDPNSEMGRMMAGMNASSSGSAGSTGVDPFAGGPESMQRLMQQFQQNSQQFGGSSGGGGFGTGAGAAAAAGGGRNASTGSASSGNANTAQNATNNDTEMTEEEMIAEAIARSLREP